MRDRTTGGGRTHSLIKKGVVRLDAGDPHLASLPSFGTTCRVVTKNVRKVAMRRSQPGKRENNKLT